MIRGQKLGGIAAILEAIVYIVGFVLILTIMNPLMDETKNGLEKLTFIIQHKVIFQWWILFIYVFFGVALVPLTIAMTEVFKDQSFIGTKIAPVFGFIWSGLVIASGMIGSVGIDSVSKTFRTNQAEALSSWQTLEIIQNALGGGVEIIGGLWVLLTSVAALRNPTFPRFLNFLGFIVGLAGILTIIPGLNSLGAVFGLLQIFWFLWIGIVLIRAKKEELPSSIIHVREFASAMRN